MAKSSNRELVTGPVGLTGTQTLSGRIPGLRLRPEFVHPECTTRIAFVVWARAM